MDSYTAVLIGMARIGAGEQVPMKMPKSGEPPEHLQRVEEGPAGKVITHWSRHGSPSGSLYTYTFDYSEPLLSVDQQGDSTLARRTG